MQIMLCDKSASERYYAFLGEWFSCNSNNYSKLIGRFYTNEFIYSDIIKTMLMHVNVSHDLSIIDPFCGDGRLVHSFLAEFMKSDKSSATKRIVVSLWDIDSSAIVSARKSIMSLLEMYPEIETIVETDIGDALVNIEFGKEKFDVCITNPPWCILKPTKSDINLLREPQNKEEYEQAAEQYGILLQQLYPHSVSVKRFGRWGINLSRCGADCAIQLLSDNGVCGIVMPASFFSDQVSAELRKWMFEAYDVKAVAYYPAELKLFGSVDQSSATVVLCNNGSGTVEFISSVYDKHKSSTKNTLDGACMDFLRVTQFAIPFGYDEEHFSIAKKLMMNGTLSAYPGLRIGRELDETSLDSKLAADGSIKFIKGFMVGRYSCKNEPVRFLNEEVCEIPVSVESERIAWRDVSRSSQKRRLQATILPTGTVTGNSLGVAYLEDSCHEQLCYLLAVMNSFVFEFQAKRQLVTNHVPGGVLRNIPIPSVNLSELTKIVHLVDKAISSNGADSEAERELECLVGIAYGLSLDEFINIVNTFSLAPGEAAKLHNLATEIWEKDRVMLINEQIKDATIIPNHYAPKLSDLDKTMISHVPQGGNWKNIPESVPSQRLAQIRESFKAGKGSRSTYYGRLRSDMPAYTISTYFPRPGNGCNIHYNQERTLTQREAARLQSFPDSFIFKGPLTAINDQIGNAVPPLLAYQLSRALPTKGQFVDLFCGAGGLSIGFIWAGWMPIVGNDINANALETHKANIKEEIINGDITHSEIMESIIKRCKAAVVAHPELPLYIIGGPPCQGFSTANRINNMNDQRNWLFKAYSDILTQIKPHGFVFENVTGILNFERGQFFEMIKSDLGKSVEMIKTFKFNCAEYAIPQRRERVVVIGSSRNVLDSFSMPPITTVPQKESNQIMLDFGDECLPNAVSTEEALSDLPCVDSGEDGSGKAYITEPVGLYQSFVRGEITAKEYIDAVAL